MLRNIGKYWDWANIGQILANIGKYWANIGQILGNYWANIGKLTTKQLKLDSLLQETQRRK